MTLVLALLLIIYFIYRIMDVFFINSSAIEDLTIDNSSLNKNLTYTICSRVVDMKPVGIDSSFKAYKNRVAFFTQKKIKIDSLKHIWYLEDKVIQTNKCNVKDSICVSYLKASKLAPGLWSVDAISGSKLYGSSQFNVDEMVQ